MLVHINNSNVINHYENDVIHSEKKIIEIFKKKKHHFNIIHQYQIRNYFHFLIYLKIYLYFLI